MRYATSQMLQGDSNPANELICNNQNGYRQNNAVTTRKLAAVTSQVISLI